VGERVEKAEKSAERSCDESSAAQKSSARELNLRSPWLLTEAVVCFVFPATLRQPFLLHSEFICECRCELFHLALSLRGAAYCSANKIELSPRTCSCPPLQGRHCAQTEQGTEKAADGREDTGMQKRNDSAQTEEKKVVGNGILASTQQQMTSSVMW
jgi:hypothetical protein